MEDIKKTELLKLWGQQGQILQDEDAPCNKLSQGVCRQIAQQEDEG